MATQGFARVTPAHQDALVRKYRKLLGERGFWVKRVRHPLAPGELSRVEAAITALATALPLVVPGLLVERLKPLPHACAVPLPGGALKRESLASLRKLGGTASAHEVTEHVIATHRIDTLLHDAIRLERRVAGLMAGMADRGILLCLPGPESRWSLKR